jgi:hypothetical protein
MVTKATIDRLHSRIDEIERVVTPISRKFTDEDRAKALAVFLAKVRMGLVSVEDEERLRFLAKLFPAHYPHWASFLSGVRPSEESNPA